MNDPKRLRETHAGQLEGLLLASVRADAPHPSARARTLRAVAFGVAAGTAAAGASSSAPAAIPSGKAAWIVVAAKWLAIGASAGAVVAGIAAGPLQGALERLAEPSRPVARTKARAVTPSRDRSVVPRAMAEPLSPGVGPGFTPPAPAAAFGASRTPSQERGVPAPVVAPSRVPDDTGAVAPAAPSSPSTLSDEVAYLDAASRALRDHDPARARAVLDAYGARFGGGNLGPEATALRAEAFLEQGDRAEAERIAQAFLSRHPHSPHAARLRALLGQSPIQ